MEIQKINNPAQKTALPVPILTPPTDSESTQNSCSAPPAGPDSFGNGELNLFSINIQSPVGSLLNENFSTGFNGTSNLRNDDLPSTIGIPFDFGDPLLDARFPSNVNFAHLDLSLTETPQDDSFAPRWVSTAHLAMIL